MSINSPVSNISFTSKCCPIKPFTVKTKMGEIRFEEIPVEFCEKESAIRKMVDFFFANFSKNTRDPGWLKFQLPENAAEFKKFKESFYPVYKWLFREDDGHLSMLVARNEKNEVCGGCLSYGFDEVPASRKTTLYIDSLAVDERYRGLDIGRILVEKSIEAGKGFFTDIFLHGEKLAGGFYEKLGFKKLNPRNPAQKKVIDYIANDRFDYPEYINLYSRPLQPNKPRWYKLAAEAIEKEQDEKIKQLFMQCRKQD
ncbi:GNAT family N-acetyltransferase [bacterium]|nr:GNAT family N-acetyltransferase [bacterium]